MARRIGERASSTYVRHPSASTTDPLSDGWFVDAGTWMLTEGNVHVLQKESLRTLVESPGFQITNFASTAAVFQGFVDPVAYGPPAFSGLEHNEIPWDRRTSVRFGPLVALNDFALADGRLTGRKIRCRLEMTIDAAASSYRAYFGLTSTEASPYGASYRAFDWGAFAGTGNRAVEKDLELADVIPAEDQWRGRSSATDNRVTVTVAPFYLWFGWRVIGGTASYVDAFSAWEIE